MNDTEGSAHFFEELLRQGQCSCCLFNISKCSKTLNARNSTHIFKQYLTCVLLIY